MAYNWCLCGHTKGIHKIIDKVYQRALCYICDETYMSILESYDYDYKLIQESGFILTFCEEFKLDNLRYLEAKAKIKEKK